MRKFVLYCSALSIPLIAIGQFAGIATASLLGSLLLIPAAITVLGAFIWMLIIR